MVANQKSKHSQNKFRNPTERAANRTPGTLGCGGSICAVTRPSTLLSVINFVQYTAIAPDFTDIVCGCQAAAARPVHLIPQMTRPWC